MKIKLSVPILLLGTLIISGCLAEQNTTNDTDEIIFQTPADKIFLAANNCVVLKAVEIVPKENASDDEIERAVLSGINQCPSEFTAYIESLLAAARKENNVENLDPVVEETLRVAASESMVEYMTESYRTFSSLE